MTRGGRAAHTCPGAVVHIPSDGAITRLSPCPNCAPPPCRVAPPVDAPAAAVEDPAVTHCLMTVTLPVGNGTTMDAQRIDDNSRPYLSVRALGSEALIIATGEFDLASAPAAAAVFSDVLTETCGRVVIDVSGVTFLDAAGLRALRAAPRSNDEGVEIRLVAPSRPVRRILELIETCPRGETSIGAPNCDGRSSSTSIGPVVQAGD